MSKRSKKCNAKIIDRTPYRLLIVTVAFLLCWLALVDPRTASAQYFSLPPDAGVIDVTLPPYNAAGNGSTDDTQSILRALREADAGGGKPRILYFPAGVYLVSNTLDWRTNSGRWLCCVTFWGENRDLSIIKLKDATPGFEDPLYPKAVLYTASLVEQNDPTSHQAKGEGNKGFFNSILNLTVDVGASNPGAIGIDYLANNVGTIRNVTIRSSDPARAGAAGLSLERAYPGPALITDVMIEGFDIGLSFRQLDHSITLKDVVLRHQRRVGIRNSKQVIAIYNLTSVNSMPVIENTDAFGLISIVKGSFQGGGNNQVAIRNEGGLYARDLSISGYSHSIINNAGHKNSTDSRYITSFSSHTVATLFESSEQPLQLPVENSPDYYSNNFSRWANITDFGAIPDDYRDDSRAIQAAIDSGADLVYFPNGQYHVSRTIQIRGNVRKILGLASFVINTGSYFDNLGASLPVFEVVDGANSFVVIENFWFSGFDNATLIEHHSSRTLVVRDCQLSASIGIRNTLGAGKLFIENVGGHVGLYYSQDVWAWQLNPEGSNDVMGATVLNQGARLWVMGLKTEHANVVIKTTSGGKTEVYGGLLYPVTRAPDAPAFINDQAHVSLSYAVTSYRPDGNYQIHVQEVKGETTRFLERDDVETRSVNYGSLVPLYVGR